MAPTYFDSSVILAILRGEPSAKAAQDFWRRGAPRSSSRLLAAECLTVLRRSARSGAPGMGTEWLAAAVASLQTFLAEVTLVDVTRAVTERIDAEDQLGANRALDAVHLGTALLLRDQQDAPDDYVFCTFDGGQASTAVALGFRVLPEP